MDTKAEWQIKKSLDFIDIVSHVKDHNYKEEGGVGFYLNQDTDFGFTIKKKDERIYGIVITVDEMILLIRENDPRLGLSIETFNEMNYDQDLKPFFMKIAVFFDVPVYIKKNTHDQCLSFERFIFKEQLKQINNCIAQRRMLRMEAREYNDGSKIKEYMDSNCFNYSAYLDRHHDKDEYPVGRCLRYYDNNTLELLSAYFSKREKKEVQIVEIFYNKGMDGRKYYLAIGIIK